MSTNKGCAPGKSSLIGLGSAGDYDGCAILHDAIDEEMEPVSGGIFFLT